MGDRFRMGWEWG